MTTPTRKAAIALGVAALVIALDQWTKLAVVAAASRLGYASRTLLGPIHLSFSTNRGVSFGFLRGDGDWTRWALSGFSLVVSIALLRWSMRAQNRITVIGLGLIMGGALGNMVDRLVRGAVVDFIDASALHFPWVFNVADSAITVGVALLLFENLLAPASNGRNGAKGVVKIEAPQAGALED